MLEVHCEFCNAKIVSKFGVTIEGCSHYPVTIARISKETKETNSKKRVSKENEWCPLCSTDYKKTKHYSGGCPKEKSGNTLHGITGFTKIEIPT
ncbi:MAG: hypothetical protein GY804_01005 [Alphaproteobacteria bacterium]|nr:hypothetical protein [Alphaproteobacteria bacterium]